MCHWERACGAISLSVERACAGLMGDKAGRWDNIVRTNTGREFISEGISKGSVGS